MTRYAVLCRRREWRKASNRRKLFSVEYAELAGTTSTAGNAVEALTMNFTHTMHQAYNYRIDNLSLAPGGAILYGARVKYRLQI